MDASLNCVKTRERDAPPQGASTARQAVKNRLKCAIGRRSARGRHPSDGCVR